MAGVRVIRTEAVESGEEHEDVAWPTGPPGRLLVVDLFRTCQQVVTQVNVALGPFELSLARFQILRLIAFQPEARMIISELGRRLQVDSTSVSSAVDLLESQGLVTRMRHDLDRRKVLVMLTPRGTKVVEQATTALNQEVFADLGVKGREMTGLWGVLKALRINAGDFEPVLPRSRRRKAASAVAGSRA
jgi:DNA-binding MarR family transcriptional regulator